MSINPVKRAILAFALVLASGVAAAHAHVTLEVREANVGGGYRAVFKVPHGCVGSSTVEIRIDIPEGVIAVKPMPKPGWTLELAKGPYARAYAFYHGKQLAQGVRQVTWRGGPLPDEYYDEFVLSTFIAGELQAGGKLAFPVTQRCEKGEISWSEVAKDGEDAHALEFPAPRLLLTAATADEHQHNDAGAGIVHAGSLAIEGAWARATPPGATTTAGYLKITNTGSEPDVLIGAASDAAERVELHETAVDEKGVASMRPLADGLTITAGAAVELKPLGRHLMVMGVKAPLNAGGTLTLQLRFKHAGVVSVPLQVRQTGPGAHAH